VASDEAGDGLEAAEAADPTNRVLMGSADRALLLVLTKLLDEAGVLRDLWEGVGAPLPSGLAPQATLQAAASQAHTAAEGGGGGWLMQGVQTGARTPHRPDR